MLVKLHLDAYKWPKKSVWSPVPFHHAILFSNKCTGRTENRTTMEMNQQAGNNGRFKISFLSKRQMFPVSCRFSSFTISVHTEIFISRLICFIICIKACNGTVSNLLIFRIPLCGITQQQKIAPKMIIIQKKEKNRSSNIALKIYRNYLPKMISHFHV